VGSALCANLLASEAHEHEIPRRTSDGQVRSSVLPFTPLTMDSRME
jgi:hypothetical protein